MINTLTQLPPNSERIAEGGSRLKGKIKKSNPGKPLITYITAVRNNVAGMARCMESIWNQTYDNIEYIVLDACSTDGTLDLIRNCADKIDYFVSEPDSGVYNAMNKALGLANGELICFMNSDDWAESTAGEIVASLFMSNDSGQLGFICGEADIYEQNGTKLFRWPPKKVHAGTMISGMPIVHQTVYASKQAFKTIGFFEESYHLFADFKWIQNVYNSNLLILYTDSLLANYTLGGISNNNQQLGVEEACRILMDFFPFLSYQDSYVLHKNINEHAVFFPEKEDDWVTYETLFALINRYEQHQDFIKAFSYALAIRCTELRDKTLHWNQMLEQRNHSLAIENQELRNELESKQDQAILKLFKNTMRNLLRNTIFFKPVKKIHELVKRIFLYK